MHLFVEIPQMRCFLLFVMRKIFGLGSSHRAGMRSQVISSSENKNRKQFCNACRFISLQREYITTHNHNSYPAKQLFFLFSYSSVFSGQLLSSWQKGMHTTRRLMFIKTLVDD